MANSQKAGKEENLKKKKKRKTKNTTETVNRLGFRMIGRDPRKEGDKMKVLGARSRPGLKWEEENALLVEARAKLKKNQRDATTDTRHGWGLRGRDSTQIHTYTLLLPDAAAVYVPVCVCDEILECVEDFFQEVSLCQSCFNHRKKGVYLYVYIMREKGKE